MKLAHRKTIAQRGRRFHDLVDFFVEYWPKIAFGFISLVGLFVSAFPDLKVQGFLIRHALFCVVLVLAIVAGWADLRRSASLKELEKRNARLNTQCRQYEKDVEKVLKVALKRLAEECEIVDNENLLKHMRITVYCHDADFRRFIPVARIAGDARYEEPGRTFYPDNEGAIAEGWNTGTAKMTVPGKGERQWIESMVQEWDIPKETAASMRMKSRSLGAFLLRISTDKVGVLVVESLQTTVVGAPLLRKISSSQWFSAIGLLVHSVKRLPRRGFSPGKTC